jgi:Carboxypeptidase regulatory-like domain
MLCGLPAQAQQPADPPATQAAPATSPTAEANPTSSQTNPASSGAIRGTIVDKTGTLLAGVHVRLTRDEQNAGTEVISGEDGQFEIVNAAPGPFQLAFTATGFAAQVYAGTLHSGEVLAVPEVTLQVATEVTTVRVEESTIEIAQEQIHEQEKQRVLAIIPNFYVSYDANPAPLDTKQKYELAWKSTLDPATFVVAGAIAGVQQATNSFSGYGQGAQGYAKRYGATYADILTGTFLGSAVFPSLMHQDPRYFYKGTGSVKSRFYYAIANAVICKSDTMHWQLCYSSLLGSLVAGGISNAYYPASDRGAALTFENFGIGIGATAGVNLLQEFVLRKLTPHSSKKPDPANP